MATSFSSSERNAKLNTVNVDEAWQNMNHVILGVNIFMGQKIVNLKNRRHSRSKSSKERYQGILEDSNS